MQEEAGRIQYSTAIVEISRPHDQDAGDYRFVLKTQSTAGSGDAKDGAGPTSTVLCKSVVVATGLSKPNAAPAINGIELTLGYEELPATGESFEGTYVRR